MKSIWVVMVECEGGWTVHSEWSSRAAAQDQADYVRGKVKRITK